MSTDPAGFTTPPRQVTQSASLPTSKSARTSPRINISTATLPSSVSTAGALDPFAVFSVDSSTRPSESDEDVLKIPSGRSVFIRLRRNCKLSICRWLLILLALLISLQLFVHHLSFHNDPFSLLESNWRSEVRHLQFMKRKKRDPVKWLKENSYPNDLKAKGPKAALISLVRNEELDGILQSMRQLEFHWNQRYEYPWIFFNEKPFSEEFKAATSNATSARTEYHLVPRAHWLIPPHINQTLYYNSLDYLSLTSVGKGHLLSYHAMIRWQSGLFYLHPALAQYDYYWRVEPDVHFFCNIPYDPFRFMHANEMVYGFNMAILDDARSFASLWSTTREFITDNPGLIHPEGNLDWLLDPATGLNYNNCQFFSNFEIGSLNFFRDNEGSRKYFDWLEEKGGFFYSRWGDAPVHTLMVSMFTSPEKIWWFRDVGYQHDIARHCPPPTNIFDAIHDTEFESESSKKDKGASSQEKKKKFVDDMGWPLGRCTCEPTTLDENFYRLIPMESPQMKPSDTCIRLWLGGEWLKKKDGWRQEAEMILGGDGYGGYVLDGM